MLYIFLFIFLTDNFLKKKYLFSINNDLYQFMNLQSFLDNINLFYNNYHILYKLYKVEIDFAI